MSTHHKNEVFSIVIALKRISLPLPSLSVENTLLDLTDVYAIKFSDNAEIQNQSVDTLMNSPVGYVQQSSEELSECLNLQTSLGECPYTHNCSLKGRCCECLRNHRAHNKSVRCEWRNRACTFPEASHGGGHIHSSPRELSKPLESLNTNP